MTERRFKTRGSVLFSCAIGLAALLAGAAQAETYYVNGATGDDSWDGLCETWDGGTCGPKKTIQAGINAAADDDEVIVADGVYSGTGNTTVLFYGKAVTVRSANGPDNCIVDVQNQAVPAFRFANAEGPNTQLDGFTVMKCSGC
jgi:hypothetical protein